MGKQGKLYSLHFLSHDGNTQENNRFGGSLIKSSLLIRAVAAILISYSANFRPCLQKHDQSPFSEAPSTADKRERRR